MQMDDKYRGFCKKKDWLLSRQFEFVISEQMKAGKQ